MFYDLVDVPLSVFGVWSLVFDIRLSRGSRVDDSIIKWGGGD